MRRVWKVDVPVDDQVHAYRLPTHARVIHVACQHFDAPAPVGLVQVWLEVDDAEPLAERRFIVHGTGHPVEKGEYVGTGIEMSGRLVWHVYQRPADASTSDGES